MIKWNRNYSIWLFFGEVVIKFLEAKEKDQMGSISHTKSATGQGKLGIALNTTIEYGMGILELQAVYWPIRRDGDSNTLWQRVKRFQRKTEDYGNPLKYVHI